MPPAETFPIAELLTPVPGDSPAGADPRAGAGPSSPYYLAKDARNQARAAERLLENGEPDAPPADWRPVARHALAALAKSKDLELASYLAEAQLRLAGFAGLRDGLRLIAGLVRAFYPKLYPSADEDGAATTLAPLSGLNGEDAPGTLLAPIYRVPLSAAPVTYADYLAAGATAKILDAKVREKRIADGAVTFDKLKGDVATEPALAVRQLHDDLGECLEALADYSQALTEHAAEYAPPTSAIKGALETMLAALRDLGAAQLAATAPKAAPPVAAVEAAPEPADASHALANGHAPAPAEPPGEKLPVVRTRDDALAAILQLAGYFRRTEPHSLVPYALEQAVRWAQMPLPDLFRELLPDDKLRGAFFKQVGVPGGAE